MKFNNQERIAIVSLLIEMANADKRIAYEEMIAFNCICKRLSIDHSTFVVGHSLKCEHAVEVLKGMEDSKKLDLAQLMVEIIDSDSNVDDAEIALLNSLCKLIGIDKLLS